MIFNFKLEKAIKILITLGLFLLVGTIFFQKINFTSIDLGRHLENGKIVWQNTGVLFSNFYSYTEPNLFFINHHWLSGIIFYIVYIVGDFKLLSIFNILLALLVFALTFRLSYKKSNFYLSALLALPTIFLFSERVEIRPEIFSYLLIIITWSLIEKVANNKIWRQLFWLIPLFILWVNLHIYFFIGLALISFKLATEFILAISRRDNYQKIWISIKPWAIALIGSSLACLLNPNTWKGLLYPLNIFKNYGYEIAENKTIFYLEHLFVNPNFTLFKILLVILVTTWIAYFLIYKKLRLFELFISLFFSSLALFASRNLVMFALMTMVIIPSNLLAIWRGLKNKITLDFNKLTNYFSLFLLITIICSFIYLIIDGKSYYHFIKNQPGLGLITGSDDSNTFFQEHNLQGPIFNNYDIGSALIFWLFPKNSVFVDNRPEAYTTNFFNDIYRPLQNDHQKWNELQTTYNFQTIYFSHTDGTPWAQQFLSNILNDQNWSLVYFDKSTIILVNKKTNSLSPLTQAEIRQKLRALSVTANLSNNLSLASLAQKLNQFDLAEEIYKNLLIKYPNNPQVLVALGYLYTNNNLDTALTYLNLALQQNYKLPSIYNQIGLINWQLGNYQAAQEAWKLTLKIDHQDISAIYYLKQIEELKKSGKLLIK